MNNKLPDPKIIIDSLADGAVEIAEGPVRVLSNVSKVAETFSSDVKANMDSLKANLPDNPEIIPDAAMKAVGQTVKAGLGLFQGIGTGIMDTFEAVKKQIERVTG